MDNDETYDQLLENGYNVYADFATASANYKFYSPARYPACGIGSTPT